MTLIAIACVAAGTWQIARFDDKVHENDALRANAHRAAVPVADILPLIGSDRTPTRDGVEFRTVTATGRFDVAGQTLVRTRSVGDNVGFLVLTPFRTADGTLLVVRGFVPLSGSGGAPAEVAAPPDGVVTIRGRAHTPETRNDGAAQLAQHQVESINPVEQAARLGGAMYAGYAELIAGQPGSRGLTGLPAPDLSNPAGGALEPQHFAYIIQWYLFAALALAAPFVMARAETKVRGTGDIDSVAPSAPLPEPAAGRGKPSAEELRAAKLADRYGRPR
jgi:cytochrome oxidase assembly protein ShyY1